MDKQKETFISRFINKLRYIANYSWTGVRKETRDSAGIRTLKVVNLSVRSFFDRDLQDKSMSLTYSTVLAIVPAFALLFAIGRGFGFRIFSKMNSTKAFPPKKRESNSP